MSKGSKNTSGSKKAVRSNESSKINFKSVPNNSGYLFSMRSAPDLNESANWFQLLPVIFFSSIIILIVRMASYERNMDQFYWYSGSNSLTDFFSYNKMIAIIVCAAVCLLFLLYRVFVQAFYIKRSYAYIPMIIYFVFVLLSYSASDYKEFALLGWNDRFEGTLVLLSYMLVLFYVINTIQSERNVRWVISSLAAVSAVLSLIGLSQGMGYDFFQTTLGKKLITPSWFWDRIDKLNFTFQHNEIYQTVYNINYVSFYLTLLIPIFGLIFIHSVMKGKSEPVYRKVLWGVLFSLLIFNLIGSASSGGYMGMAVVVLIALIVLNKKIIIWWKPVCILLILTVAIAGITYDRWLPEVSHTIKGVVGASNNELAGGLTEENQSDTKHKFDYMITSGDAIVLGYNGDEVTFLTYPNDPSSITVADSKGKPLPLKLADENSFTYQIDDEQFSWISLKPAKDDSENHYLIITTDKQAWNFMLTETGPKYFTGTKHLIDLHKVPSFGWENNPRFGSGRGYIWSRTIPMFKDTLILGHGADTYSIYFPNDDYVGKYTGFSDNVNIIVDKPHNMYFGYIVGTGVISVLALLVLWFAYIVQSFAIYWRSRFTDYLSFTGAGIFLGICGFLVTGFVDDSSVSVMPMFYALLGTGIAINMMIKSAFEKNHN